MSEFTAGVLYLARQAAEVEKALRATGVRHVIEALNSKWKVALTADQFLTDDQTVGAVAHVSRVGPLLFFMNAEDHGWGYTVYHRGREIQAVDVDLHGRVRIEPRSAKLDVSPLALFGVSEPDLEKVKTALTRPASVEGFKAALGIEEMSWRSYRYARNVTRREVTLQEVQRFISLKLNARAEFMDEEMTVINLGKTGNGLPVLLRLPEEYFRDLDAPDKTIPARVTLGLGHAVIYSDGQQLLCASGDTEEKHIDLAVGDQASVRDVWTSLGLFLARADFPRTGAPPGSGLHIHGSHPIQKRVRMRVVLAPKNPAYVPGEKQLDWLRSLGRELGARLGIEGVTSVFPHHWHRPGFVSAGGPVQIRCSACLQDVMRDVEPLLAAYEQAPNASEPLYRCRCGAELPLSSLFFEGAVFRQFTITIHYERTLREDPGSTFRLESLVWAGPTASPQFWAELQTRLGAELDWMAGKPSA